MRRLFSNTVLLFLWIQSVNGWMHPKCYIYGSAEEAEDMPLGYCSGVLKHLSASCQYVTDMEEDLQGLPQNINALCIYMTDDRKGVMSLGFFSQFQDLEYLYIHGCFSQILPTGNNQVPPNLEYLKLKGQYTECCDCYFGPNTFKDLFRLGYLIIENYRLSAMALDVFDGNPHLQNISILNSCEEDLSEILCRLMYVQSLTFLVLETFEIKTLNQSNCSIADKNGSMIPTFKNLIRSFLSFGDITNIEEGALTCFKNVRVMELEINHEVLRRLPLSGIKQIHSLMLYGDNDIHFASFCNVVFLLSIKEVRFVTNNPSILSMSGLDLCIGLEHLDISGGDATHSTLHTQWNVISTLKNLKTLTVIHQTGNSFDACSFQKTPITWLTCVSLRSNMKSIFAKQFSCLGNLRNLNLHSNLLSNIEDFAFLGLTNLESLNLRNNIITNINAKTFFGLYSLIWLDLRDNPLIHNIETLSFMPLRSLREVFIGKLNSPQTEPVIKLNLTLIFGDTLGQLTTLYISSSRRPMHLVIGSDITSKQNLSLILKGKTVSFEDCDRPFLKSVIHLDVHAEEFLCTSEFMGKYFKSVKTFKYRSKLSAKSIDLTAINQLIQLQKLTIISVDLIKQPSADIIFHNLTKLEVLRLYGCKIYSMEGSLTKDLKSLKRLYLQIENVYNVLYSFTESLYSLKYLIFSQFHLFCICDNAWLISWALQNRQVEVILNNNKKTYLKDLTCLSDNGIDTPNLVKYTDANCITDIDFILFAVTGLGVLFFMMVVLVHNLSGQYLLPLYHITLGWLSGAMRSNTRGRYDYDAFVSYSGKDERWVVEELLPNLEQRGPPFLNLCLHSRDFQLGKDIVENITDSLYRSRHTLCLVSRHYLLSNWCSLEMKLATARLQVEQRDILFLVFLEKIPPHWLSAHHRLARLMKTRTYLDWPQDPNQHQAFWERLWDKLKPLM